MDRMDDSLPAAGEHPERRFAVPEEAGRGMRQRIGLALGGGGLWGIAGIGVLKKLQEEGVPIDMIGGASMGALVAGGVCAHVDPATHCVTKEGVDHLYRVAEGVRSFDQVIDHERGRTVIAMERLLNPGGHDPAYVAMMERGPTIPYFAEVARRINGRKVSELFLEAQPGDSMAHTLQLAAASAALKPKFGIDPVTVDGVENLHDNSITRNSTNPIVTRLRQAGASKVISVPISFMDVGRDDRFLQRLYHLLRPSRSDLGDVVIRPKSGHGPTSGTDCLTNFGKGFPLWPYKFARTEEEIGVGRRIAIPTDEYMQHGYEAATKAMPEIERMLGRR